VFARAWHLLPSLRLPGRGELRPWRLLPDALDEPLLVVRDEGGELRCLSNVCTHRGNLLALAPGPARSIRCTYHGRRFGLDGRCRSMPGFEEVDDFPGPADHLPRVPAHAWGELLFAALEPRGGLDGRLTELERRVGFLPLAEFVPDDAGERTFEVEANWALYVENFLEGFHVPFVHPGLSAVLEVGQYETTLFEGGAWQVGIARGDQPVFELPPGHPDHGRAVAAYYAWLYPCTMLNFYPWGMSLNVVLPAGPTRTRVWFSSRVWRPELRSVGAGAGLDRVELEDEAIVRRVQQGVRARLYDRGRYSPTREQAVHHFHRILAAELHEPSDGAARES
jgi:choline monooxygenase